MISDFRLYQIVILAIAVFFLWRSLRKYWIIRVNLVETVLGLMFWSFIVLLALFPDNIGQWLSKAFGFESDTNAVIFFLLGLILFVIFKLYNRIRLQNKNITALTRRIALLEYEQEKDEDSLRS